MAIVPTRPDSRRDLEPASLERLGGGANGKWNVDVSTALIDENEHEARFGHECIRPGGKDEEAQVPPLRNLVTLGTHHQFLTDAGGMQELA